MIKTRRDNRPRRPTSKRPKRRRINRLWWSFVAIVFLFVSVASFLATKHIALQQSVSFDWSSNYTTTSATRKISEPINEFVGDVSNVERQQREDEEKAQEAPVPEEDKEELPPPHVLGGRRKGKLAMNKPHRGELQVPPSLERPDEVNHRNVSTQNNKASFPSDTPGASDDERRPLPPLNRSLADPLMNPSPEIQSLGLKRNVTELGVLLDAGRHYFPVDWIRNLVNLLSHMGYTMLHFRLTDDQAFNVQLDSHPELTQAAPFADRVYTPQELRELVQYAHQRNIVIMPEINVPGHAAGWAGDSPYLVVPCANFICDTGYGLPLNFSNPHLPTLLQEVLQEIKEIFSVNGRLPYLHLGGDEFHMSYPCFLEVGSILNHSLVQRFEDQLKTILDDVGFSKTNTSVLRWETTADADGAVDLEDEDDVEDDEVTRRHPNNDAKGNNFMKGRAGNVVHFWRTSKFQQYDTQVPVFASEGLYFDTNQNHDGWEIWNHTRNYTVEAFRPIGIVAGTFELGVQYWMDRNVVGRLLAVAMGASTEEYADQDAFRQRYNVYCQQLGFDPKLCQLYGRPPNDYDIWREHWQDWTDEWKGEVCNRLTEESNQLFMKTESLSSEVSVREANNVFWDNFPYHGAVIDFNHTQVEAKSGETLAKLRQHSVPHTGILLDLIMDGSYSYQKDHRIVKIIEYMAKLGFNTLQLRIVSDWGFALEMKEHKYLSKMDSWYTPYPCIAIHTLVEAALQHGVEIIPEITLAHRAGGWDKGASLASCPKLNCYHLHPFALNTSNHEFLPLIGSVARELRRTFNSPYLHLGYDEREESMQCYKESRMDVNLDKFEHKVTKTLEYIGIPMDKVIRYDNQEQREYKKRAGRITHFRNKALDDIDCQGTCFVSTGLMLQDWETPLEDGWDIYQHVQKMKGLEPKGVIAFVESINDRLMKALNLRQRLLAVAMGLAEGPPLTRKEFDEAFEETCKELSNKGCELMGKLRDRDRAQVDMTQLLKEGKTRACERRVDNVTVFLPRKGVV